MVKVVLKQEHSGGQKSRPRFRLTRADQKPQVFPDDDQLREIFRRTFGKSVQLKVISRDEISCSLEISQATGFVERHSFADNVGNEITDSAVT